jgi:hypothetical protein
MCATPAAAFELRVRGEAQLLADVRAAGTALQISGTLRDENGQPLPQRDVKLTISSAFSGRVVHEDTLRADMLGKLSAQVELEEGSYDLTLVMDADDHFDGAKLSANARLAPAPRKLDLQAPDVIFGPSPEATARVRASAGGVGIRGKVLARVDGYALEPVELDTFGRAQIKLDPGLVSGEHVVIAMLEDRPGQTPADARQKVRYVAAPAPTLSLAEGYSGLEYGIRAEGSMVDALGPLGGLRVIVTLTRPDAPDAPPLRLETRTEADGGFSVFAPSRELGEGAVVARAEVRPTAGQAAVVTSEPTTIARRASQRGLHLFGALAIIFGVAALLIRLASLDLAGWWARRRAARPAPAVVNLTLDEEAVAEVMSAADRGAMPAASLDQIGGQIWDVWRARPVAGASLRLVDGDGQTLMRWAADGAGRFVSPPLPAGDHQLMIEARGFARGVLPVRLPHGGGLSASRIQLIAMPLKLRRTYQSWAAQRSGEEVWGKKTPRELASELRAALAEASLDDEALERRLDAWAAAEEVSGVEALEAVTRVVEEGYFGEREDADEALWRLMITLLRRLEQPAPPAEVTR